MMLHESQNRVDGVRTAQPPADAHWGRRPSSRCWLLSDAIDASARERRLARLSVRLVRAAPAAVLLEFDALTRVGLVLDRHVIAPLALLASQVDRRPLVRCHVALSHLSISKNVVCAGPKDRHPVTC